ncbi:MAG: hypothetical protein LBH04_10600 [Tannerellaceae bacterium]|nr:hypothetical protein [Tannerellaceae bacterium]
MNDKVGNPIMIAAVMVWKVKDAHKAMFEINTSSTFYEHSRQHAAWHQNLFGLSPPSNEVNAKTTRIL